MTVLSLDPALERGGILECADLDATTERHRIALHHASPDAPIGDVLTWLRDRSEVRGVVMAVPAGYAGRLHLRLARRLLNAGYHAWFYWPGEEVVERLDGERLRSAWRHWFAVQAWQAARRVARRGPAPAATAASAVDEGVAGIMRDVDQVIARAAPVPFGARAIPSPDQPLQGVGVYLRTDFWARITSGGSYVHTCFVAKELGRSTAEVVALMASHYALLDESGVRQVVIEAPGDSAGELDLLRASRHYDVRLRPALEALCPAYVYERLCLGNYTGARLCQTLSIPYIVEYNGSELSMRRSFQGDRFAYEGEFGRIEEAAFRQATLISVVSDIVKDDLVARGVEAEKIVVNPNGVDPVTYGPARPDERAALRSRLGWSDRERVVCFTGTFGGWHGVDVLAAALPRIAAEAPDVRFLLIGDGTHKHLVDAAVRQAGIADRVHMTGRIPQHEGARLLPAADIYVSPHSSHMVDSRFFGSPTKLFEYMACGGGIVASDLEQIGQVLRPALGPRDFASGPPAVGDERAVLCAPGDVSGFVRAVSGLARYPAVSAALGANARRAALTTFTWEAHVRRLWRFAAGEAVESFAAPPPQEDASLARIETGDPYKDQVQHQWNNNPVGSQYVKHADAHTLEWFLEVEAHRYGEYGPWMPEVMEFDRHRGDRVLEVGGGMGTDLAQFARNGALVTDLDLSAGHLALAQENFRLRGLTGTFIHHDAETLPFPDASFDIVYSNGVIHHTPNTQSTIDEMYRVLVPGGRAIVMVYAENSLHYWGTQVGRLGLRGGLLQEASMGDIMSRSVEMTKNDARPLVKVYTANRLRAMFGRFTGVQIVKRQLTAPELPAALRWVPLELAGRLAGWNLVVKATRPAGSR